MTINIGLFVFATNTTLDPAVLARHAEALGFESFWVPEHPIIPVKTTSPYRGSPDGAIRRREEILELAEAGANRVTLWLQQTEGNGALKEMDAIARQALSA